MMNVVMLLTNPFKPDPRVLYEAKTLSEHGYKVVILAWDRECKYKKKETLNGIEIIRFHIPAGYATPYHFIKGALLFYLSVIKYCTKISAINVVHAHDLDTLLPALIIKKMKKCKLIYDAHDDYSSMIREVTPGFISKIVEIFEQILISFSDGLIASSEAIGKHIFKNKKHVVIMNCKKLSEYNINENDIRTFRMRINPENKFLIVYIGILKIWTPLRYIIEAVKRMDDVLLIIGGKGPHEKEILNMIKGCDRIKYVGWVVKKDIPLYVKSADVIVLPSNSKKRYTKYSLPNKILEGLVAGKPIIAGKNTEGGRVVEECKCGFLCDFGDVDCLVEKLNILKNNKKLRDLFGKNAYECAVKKYNWSLMEKRLLSLYENLQRTL